MTGDIVSRPNTAVGVFTRREDLETALGMLREAGFREEQTGVSMRGLRQGEAENPSEYDEVRGAALSVLTVRVDGRHDEVEEILRRCGAVEINWTNSLTAAVTGTSEEIVDSET